MKPALQTAQVEQAYEAFDGITQVKTYYHWGRREWITRAVCDPGRRENTRCPAPTGYSPIRARKGRR
jgi:hypothetical protein